MTEPRTVDAVIRLRAGTEGDKPMVVDPTSRIGYTELENRSRTLAAGFVNAGVAKGTRVGLIMPNGAQWVLIALALTRIGAVLVPLSTLLAARELAEQLRVASVQYVITVPQFRGHHHLAKLQEMASDLPALREVWTDDEAAALPVDHAARGLVDALCRAVTPSDPMAIIFTSGSSAAPKGVIHSHGNALSAVASGLSARCIGRDTRLYLPMPFFWVGGFGAGILSALSAGATLITEPIPEPARTLRLLERERVTLFRGWPDQADVLARHQYSVGADLSALRPGSLEALLPADMRAAPGARASLFGMTETFGPYCGFPADSDMPRTAWGSCGKPFAGMTVRIVDTDHRTTLPAGEVGEIEVRGPHLMRGICRRSREQVFTTDGYYRTGDLGYLDSAGYLFSRGRSDDMFKVNGATVYPAEVVQGLRDIDGVRAAFATDVAGAQGGKEVGAVVVCDTAVHDVGKLRAAAKSVLSSFKIPTVWLLSDTDAIVPRGPTGKVDTRRLRELLATTPIATLQGESHD
ncbi:MAG: acyl--CoA ligase [Mycobacterium sp.]|nr:acyl--CoA ligase [Mycobacterium sp.]